MLRTNFWRLTIELLLAGHGRLHGIPEIEPELGVSKAIDLPAILSLQSNFYLLFYYLFILLRLVEQRPGESPECL